MIDKTDKEKENMGKNEAPLEHFARELPPGLHERVMASLRADVARMGIYRRLRLTALFAAAMLCIFIVSSTMWVLPTLVRKDTTDGESCEQTSASVEAENEEDIYGASDEKQESYASETVSDPQGNGVGESESLKETLEDGNSDMNGSYASDGDIFGNSASSESRSVPAMVIAIVSCVVFLAALILTSVQLIRLRSYKKSDEKTKEGSR